ncbi:hypothetical protein M3172_24235 [Mesobacillus subterraneus]|uniref:hypothetical protein n=1 Tax=Mesobacillus subterraneus TaxID=285983 RepID=UPI00203C021A|nr:hypothetical protein [Mesobacillus subterraneus]MCM3576282.1 hypothetical protein [Mesobacillus subterraneus]
MVAKNWINGEYTNSTEKVKAGLDSFKNELYANPSFNYTSEYSLAPNEFYSEEVEKSAYADKHFLLKSKIDGEEKTMLIKFMQEGDVRSLAEINHLNQQQQEKRFKRQVDFIIALYRSREELECDIVDKFEYVLFTSLDSLISNKSPFIHNGKVVSI